MRDGEPDDPALLASAKGKLQRFISTARTSAFLSEARGWLAYVDYLLGDHTAAGKIYIDELNRNGSNLSRETLLNSLQINYGYDGGPDLLAHLEEYFDTPEHAAFAISLATNPHWPDYDSGRNPPPEPPPDNTAQSYERIQSLLEKHRDLLQRETGANALALLAMRTALRVGDPPGVLKIAAMIPATAADRAEPDFDWMLASADFLTHDFAAAEPPLLALFQSTSSAPEQKAAAAYALCGVYLKLHNPVEQIHFALWLAANPHDEFYPYPTDGNEDMSVYWAVSGWDRNLLLESEAPIEALEAFLKRYPNAKQTRIVKYSLAVRLARENRYDYAAQIYQSVGAVGRAPRMRQLAQLYHEANRTDLPPPQLQDARYKLADFLAAHPEGIYFNDLLWNRLQRYALYAADQSGFTRSEHEASAVEGERKLKDDQEERWRAYLILRDVVRDAGKTELGRKAALLALSSLRRINTGRFGREDDIAQATSELATWLRTP